LPTGCSFPLSVFFLQNILNCHLKPIKPIKGKEVRNGGRKDPGDDEH
jgi:hypothetical protein